MPLLTFLQRFLAASLAFRRKKQKPLPWLQKEISMYENSRWFYLDPNTSVGLAARGKPGKRSGFLCVFCWFFGFNVGIAPWAQPSWQPPDGGDWGWVPHPPPDQSLPWAHGDKPAKATNLRNSGAGEDPAAVSVA